ncbi:hypothetical protein LO771_12200 [Streptacidiphilus sp. ASG 303]|uniref:hypothetical protein n=1 Tax=Streptacidiphilus sp. ASG 303 TaxID=2896847 RepID=UPI001E2E3A30|nr:hypothetical protein [Streptacidiphilus sp. ASG 303]MCD0483147.1 hypothetical protein [Streptacidiphilus sp. ASG 303]
MSAVTAPRRAAAARDDGTRGAVLALARIEAVRLLRFPAVAAALLGHAAWLLWPGGPSDRHPVLRDVALSTQLPLLLAGLAALLGANSAVLRARRHGAEGWFGTLLLRPGGRTLAHVLSVLPTAAVSALLAVWRLGWAASRPGASGHASAAELAAGPAAVLLLGAAGVLLGRLTASAFAAPLAVVVVITFDFVLVTPPDGPAWLRWLVPVVSDVGRQPLPGRPAGAHVLYLVSLAVLAGAAAVLAAGGRSAAVRTVAGVSLAAAVAGAVLQGLPMPGAEQARTAAAGPRPAAPETSAAAAARPHEAAPARIAPTVRTVRTVGVQRWG